MYELETTKFMFNYVHKTLLKPLMEHFTLNIAYHDHNTRKRQAPHVKSAALCYTKGHAIWGNLT